jgi:hypothetical protein
MLEVTDKGIAMHRRLRGYDDTGEISIGNVLGKMVLVDFMKF